MNTLPVLTNIQRFSVHDGPGIRTTVFFKGCPLACVWCHNPETHQHCIQPQLVRTRCAGCGCCEQACPAGCHRIEYDTQSQSFRHFFDCTQCIRCFACVDACRYQAMEKCGYSLTADEIVALAAKDKPFYGEKGGITLSGGEPMLYPDFVGEVLAKSKSSGLSTCVQTCGIGADKLDTDVCDHIYYDIKTLDGSLHQALTGRRNEVILQNLKLLADTAAEKITVRTVIVRGLTDSREHVTGIRDFIRTLGISRFELNAFHPYGSSKADAVGLSRTFMGTEYVPDDAAMSYLRSLSLLDG